MALLLVSLSCAILSQQPEASADAAAPPSRRVFTRLENEVDRMERIAPVAQ
jgi:hypothetical protein